MEGTLWKWTNYFKGWQQRWFILQNGVLSYYLNSNDVNESCKGSLKIPACDILTYHSDPTRMDLVIPGEAYFYLKATNHLEKQKWLQCFGSAKACYSNSGSINIGNDSDKADATEILSVKKSELRVYCDLLMQQVNEIKISLLDSPKIQSDPSELPLNASSNVLAATCDAFVRILDDCMQLSGAAATRRHSSRSHDQSPESSKINLPIIGPLKFTNNLLERSISDNCKINPILEYEATNGTTVYNKNNCQLPTDNNFHSDNLYKCVPTFFSLIQFSFVDIRLTNNFEIPTTLFLDACRNFITIFDRLKETAFVPAKLDMSCNIKKIYQKHLCDVNGYATLESIMKDEVNSNIAQNLNSATLAILWLSRSLKFAELLLRKLATSNPECEFSPIATQVYQSTLAAHHGPVVRNAFSIAISSSISVKEMVKRLLLTTQDSHLLNQSMNSNKLDTPTNLDSDQSIFDDAILNEGLKYDWSISQLRRDIIDYAEGIQSILQILFKFINENNLNFNDKV